MSSREQGMDHGNASGVFPPQPRCLRLRRCRASSPDCPQILWFLLGTWLPRNCQESPVGAKALTHFAAAVTPTPRRRSGPGASVSPPEGPDLPLIPVRPISMPAPSLLSTSCAGPKGMCEGKSQPGCSLCLQSFLRAKKHPPSHGLRMT